MVKISPGNTKTGAIPSLSLPPITTCRVGAPCANDGCYALKAWRMYSSVRNALTHNLTLWRESPQVFAEDIVAWLHLHQPEMFRWHVSGDVPDADYFRMIVTMAQDFPKTKFLLFTKQYELVAHQLATLACPVNLRIVLSKWPKLSFENPHDLPVAYLAEDSETPLAAFPCAGKCDICAMCWKLDNGEAVVFNRH